MLYKDKWDACHLCKYKNCWNPLHLYQGTEKSNVRDAIINKRHTSYHESIKTHCPANHAYTEKNTYINPETGKRKCITCKYINRSKWYYRHKESKNA